VRRIESVRFRVGGDGYESPIDDSDEDVDALGNNGDVRETFDVVFGVAFGALSGEWIVKGVSARESATETGELGERDGQPGIERDRDVQPTTAAGWKAKFLETQRKLWEREEESRELKERILEAVL
jgi:hypothetical protein